MSAIARHIWTEPVTAQDVGEFARQVSERLNAISPTQAVVVTGKFNLNTTVAVQFRSQPEYVVLQRVQDQTTNAQVNFSGETSFSWDGNNAVFSNLSFLPIPGRTYSLSFVATLKI
jgi:hypothetical protein